MSIEKFKERLKATGVLYVDLYPYRLNEEGKVEFLILKRKSDVELADSWQAISGKIKADEKISHAFWRLAAEKAGIKPNKVFKIDYVNIFYDDYYDTVMMVPVAACQFLLTDKIKISELHVEYKWILEDEIDQYLIWPNQITSIKLIQKIIKLGDTFFRELKNE